MIYAQIVANEITAVGRLPRSARRLDTREWVMGLESASVELQQACGWHEVVDTARPADTDTTTHDRSVEQVAGVPTVVWTERPWTRAELDAQAAAANDTTIRTRADQALNDLRTIAGSSGTLTGAQLSNAVRLLAKVCIALVRLQLSKLDATD